MSAFPDRQWDGWYFDGRTAQRHHVAVRVLSDGLAIISAESGSRRWAYDRIRQTQGAEAGQPVRLELTGESPEILIVPDQGILAAMRDAAPTSRRRFRLRPRWSAWITATIATVIAIIFLTWGLYAWGIPTFANAVAARLPVAWEEELGATVTEELVPVTRRCSNREQHEVLERIVGRLTASGPSSAYRYTIILSEEDTPNAFAAPGGYVVLTTGLLQLSERPEEIAGVMAHEVQHIVQRHATRLLVRELSVGVLVSLAAGDVRGLRSALQVARGLGRLRYQRADETSADRGAVGLLTSARIDPKAMITVLQRLQRSPAAGLQPPAYLSTHPALSERIAAVSRLAAETPVDPVPLLPEVPWGAMVQRCS